MPTTRTSAVLAFVVASLLCLGAPCGAAQPIVGDANGDGAFDVGDVAFTIDALRFSSQRPNPLADVALPCSEVLEPVDGQRLLGAWLAAQDGITVRSRCHGQAIGTAIAPPPSPPALVTLDDQLTVVAQRVPELGGLFVRGRDLQVVLTQPSATNLNRALDAIEIVFGRERFDGLTARAIRGDYTFPQLRGWKDVATSLLAARRATLVDADERANRIRIGLADLASQASVEKTLTSLGVPLAAVVFEQRRPARLTADPLTTALREKQRPLVGGLAFERPGATCSIGFLAKRYGELRGFVTNSHCLPPMGQYTGLAVFQDGIDPDPTVPQILDDQAGVEFEDPPFGCGGTCRMSDAAFVAIDHGESGRLGRLAGAPGTDAPFTFYGHYTVIGKGAAVCGESVRRVAAISGEVSGEVTGTCEGIAVDTSGVAGAPAEAFYGCQTTYAAPSQDGDSGGPVFKRGGGGSEVELLGVHWGSHDGEAVYSPISNIESQVGSLDVVEQNEPPDVEITAPADGGSVGGGAFPVVELAAVVFDFEGGGSCAECSVHWYSGKDGVLGTTAWTDGASSLDAVLGGGPGYRAITATAYDASGQSAWDTIVLSSGNSGPAVALDWPPTGATLYRNVPYQLQGSSFDAEAFSALPCADMTWTVSGPSSAWFPQTGCFPIVTFESTGSHALTLDGVDAGNLHGSDAATISVVDAPASAAPVVTFISPPPGSGFAPASWVTVSATVTDPGGSGSIALEWRLESPSLDPPGPWVALGTDSVASGGTRSVQFRPQDHLSGGCGGAPMTVRLRATDSSAATGQGTLPLVAMSPPC
jgi:hypothetical protein